ncbi:ABC transporter permease [Rhizobium sp. CF142]|uniref:ABC transporter permease n=1 Tax=Rhizobium sp. CF142 TaxID=1144314 RepID=UPI00026EEC19|nr:ABC transporter permease [Rhizobium sp. CF142]EJJ26692.1 ABC-type spermidine/putrescine transport system, permease component I [Rhizobium sp. CF142]
MPLILLYGGLFLLPLFIVCRMALENGLGSFANVLSSRVFMRVVENTLTISVTTTLVSVALGYLLATLLWKTAGWQRLVVLGFVLLPFWTSVLIKNFAWTFLLQDNGVINSILQSAGLADQPLPLLHNRFAVIVGMVHYSLPYAVFPIYTSMLTIDPRLERAARSLGASTLSAFWHVTLPLTRPGVYASSLLIFIVASSFYVTPVILGGPRQMMIANLVDYYTHTLVDFSSGAALSIIILIAASLLIAIYQSLPKEGQHG